MSATAFPSPVTRAPTAPEGTAFSGWFLEVHPEVDTTNRLAARLPVWHAVRADTQTAGRGRTGRAWTSDRGGLWLSAVVPCPGPRGRWALLPLAVGWALLDALQEFGVSDLRLRWPNDLLVGGRKLAGILMERHSADTAVVGLGLNVFNHPEDAAPDLRGTTARLADLAPLGRLDLDDIAALVLRAIARAHRRIRDNDFARIAADLNLGWRAAPRSVALSVAGQVASVTGLFTGIDSAGRLLLRTADGAYLALDATQVAHRREV